MGDLLTNIALKALRPTGEIQPWLRTRFEPLPTAPHVPDPVTPNAMFHPRLSDHSVKPQAESMSRAMATRETKRRSAVEKTEPGVSRHPTIGPPKLEPINKPTVEKARPIQVNADSRSIDTKPAASRVVIVPKVVPYRESKTPSVHTRKDVPDIQIKSERREADAVHITIGRVEVRAMVESAPRPQRQATKPAVMTLDEYLTRRAKGGSS